MCRSGIPSATAGIDVREVAAPMGGGGWPTTSTPTQEPQLPEKKTNQTQLRGPLACAATEARSTRRTPDRPDRGAELRVALDVFRERLPDLRLLEAPGFAGASSRRPRTLRVARG